MLQPVLEMGSLTQPGLPTQSGRVWGRHLPDSLTGDEQRSGAKVNFSGAPEGKQHFCIFTDPNGYKACLFFIIFFITGSKTEYFMLKYILSYSQKFF